MTIVYDGQRYDYLGDEPHTKHNGEATTLARWRSNCADCGEAFELRTPAVLDLGKAWLSRRCPEHHAPGRGATVSAKIKIKRRLAQQGGPRRRG